jgi:hypothetical protein
MLAASGRLACCEFLAPADEGDDFEFVAVAQFAGGVLCTGDDGQISLDGEEAGVQFQREQQIGQAAARRDLTGRAVDADRDLFEGIHAG